MRTRPRTRQVPYQYRRRYHVPSPIRPDPSRSFADSGKRSLLLLMELYPDERHSRLDLFFYELSRDIYLYFLSFKRPELSVRGLVFAYHTEPARRIGIRVDIKRGEDGTLAMHLREVGKIVFIHDRKARAVTGYGTVGQDGSLLNSLKVRVYKALRNIHQLFTKQEKYQDEESNLIK